MRDIEIFIHEKRNEAITEIRKIGPRSYLVLLETRNKIKTNHKCYICGRAANSRSKAGHICSNGRKNACVIVFKCFVCEKVYKPQKPYLQIDMEKPTCSHKCHYEITLKEWKEENQEESKEIAIKNGYRNIGIMREELVRIQKEDRSKFITWCSKGGKIGGSITAKKHKKVWKRNLLHEKKLCNICGFYIAHKGGACCNCLAIERGYENYSEQIKLSIISFIKASGFNSTEEFWKHKGIGIRKAHCVKCKKETLHNGNRCFICDPWKNSFDRDAFYAEPFSLVSFESIDQPISFGGIKDLEGVPGVWSINAVEPGGTVRCLEVCETSDIGKEMRRGTLLIRAGHRNLHKTDQEIHEEFTSSQYTRKKYRDICRTVKESGAELIFKLVVIGVEDKQDRFAIEAQHAHDERAVFWSPAPMQGTKQEVIS